MKNKLASRHRRTISTMIKEEVSVIGSCQDDGRRLAPGNVSQLRLTGGSGLDGLTFLSCDPGRSVNSFTLTPASVT